jgi:adenylate cyclase
MSRRWRKRLYHTLALALVGCSFTMIAVWFQPLYSINLWLTDQLYTTEALSPNVVIVGVDDATLASYGRWSDWPRSLHAQAINNLSTSGARVIGFDVLFADSSPDDQVLAMAMADAGNVVLASVGTEPVRGTGPEITFNHFLTPVPALENASGTAGHVNLAPDPDGTVRRLPLIVKDMAGNRHAALSIAVLHRLFAMPLPTENKLVNGKLNLAGRDVPVDAGYRLLINYSAAEERRPYLSYGDVISGEFDPSLVKNKILLVGMTATGGLDAWAIPTSATKVPGVFIHAAAMDTILTQRFLIETGTGVTLVTMLLLVGVTALALPRLGTRYLTDMIKAAVLTGGLLIVYLLVSFFAFDQGYVLGILYPVSVLAAVYVSNLLCIAAIEQWDKRFVKDLFGRYISPQVAQEVVRKADTSELQLSGEEREVTVLFADIRNFTQMCENLSPEAVVGLLNTYLTVIVDAVLNNAGMVNKFGGDNIVAVWNAPQSQPDHAPLAVKAALEAQQKMALAPGEFNSAPVQFGIGINTGIALAGTVGSVGRAEYTVIGDAVNVASRICSTTPGGEVWIGAETYRSVMDNIEVEELEPQQFKGKSKSLTIYRVIGWK